MSAISTRFGRAPHLATDTVLRAGPTGSATAQAAPSPAQRALILVLAVVVALVLAVSAASPASAAGKGGKGGGGGGSNTAVTYSALGDSYAAGQGAGSYLNTSCYVSSKGYPALIDADRKITLNAEPACSGDSSLDVVGRQAPLVPATTTRVTLTVGGNDVGFENVMQNCFVLISASSCSTAIAVGDAMVADGTITGRITAAVNAIRAKAPNARVIVTGYPRLFAPTVTRAYAQQVNVSTTALNSAIRTGADSAGAVYVDVEAAFAGHGIGSSSPWINDWNWLSFSAGFHPNASGYAAYAAQVKTVW
ncbi:SGNH/GDSL hydrolase family protein [Microbacterium sp. W4I4]|uniref:SGNH/GDSL hydrolase family protein n=1 Tax=Microbacterium sp. W4I4 TaxID=3042295 RepID=UPI0027D7E962|nr:SGNH/GDSL hydrolase family protein [Microbacterium sp. W4I4]